jgi:hypothetical protein
VRLLESKFARRNDPKGGDTIRTVEPTS